METCSNCGAALSPDIEWCGLCFTPTGRVPEKELIVLPDVDADAERAAPDPWTNALFSALVVAFVVVAFIDLWNLTGDVGSAPPSNVSRRERSAARDRASGSEPTWVSRTPPLGRGWA